MKLLQIGFCLYPANATRSRLQLMDFMYLQDKGTSGPYINYREVFARFELAPGAYIIVPATFEPDAESRFMIRAYSDNKFSLKELK